MLAVLLTTGCVSTAKDNSTDAVAVVNESPLASTVFTSRLQPVATVKTSTLSDNSVKVGFGGDTMFSHDGTGLNAQAQQQLTAVANALSALSFNTIMVLGYTDSSGQLAYNNKLSKQRAEQVKAFLVQQGMAATQLVAEGRGPAEPIADNKTAQGRAANRRVELVVTF